MTVYNSSIEYHDHILSIRNNPLASKEEISQLSGVNQLMHPNCPTDLWWDLAKEHPLYVRRHAPIISNRSPFRVDGTNNGTHFNDDGTVNVICSQCNDDLPSIPITIDLARSGRGRHYSDHTFITNSYKIKEPIFSPEYLSNLSPCKGRHSAK